MAPVAPLQGGRRAALHAEARYRSAREGGPNVMETLKELDAFREPLPREVG
jgi:hypothetical protein